MRGRRGGHLHRGRGAAVVSVAPPTPPAVAAPTPASTVVIPKSHFRLVAAQLPDRGKEVFYGFTLSVASEPTREWQELSVVEMKSDLRRRDPTRVRSTGRSTADFIRVYLIRKIEMEDKSNDPSLQRFVYEKGFANDFMLLEGLRNSLKAAEEGIQIKKRLDIFERFLAAALSQLVDRLSLFSMTLPASRISYLDQTQLLHVVAVQTLGQDHRSLDKLISQYIIDHFNELSTHLHITKDELLNGLGEVQVWTEELLLHGLSLVLRTTISVEQVHHSTKTYSQEGDKVIRLVFDGTRYHTHPSVPFVARASGATASAETTAPLLKAEQWRVLKDILLQRRGIDRLAELTRSIGGKMQVNRVTDEGTSCYELVIENLPITEADFMALCDLLGQASPCLLKHLTIKAVDITANAAHLRALQEVLRHNTWLTRVTLSKPARPLRAGTAAEQIAALREIYAQIRTIETMVSALGVAHADAPAAPPAHTGTPDPAVASGGGGGRSREIFAEELAPGSDNDFISRQVLAAVSAGDSLLARTCLRLAVEKGRLSLAEQRRLENVLLERELAQWSHRLARLATDSSVPLAEKRFQMELATYMRNHFRALLYTEGAYTEASAASKPFSTSSSSSASARASYASGFFSESKPTMTPEEALDALMINRNATLARAVVESRKFTEGSEEYNKCLIAANKRDSSTVEDNAIMANLVINSPLFATLPPNRRWLLGLAQSQGAKGAPRPTYMSP